VLVGSWAALTLGLLSPWLVRLLGPPDFYEGSRVVALLSFAAVAFGAYVVVVIAIGRARKMGPNVLITGAAAVLNVLLNILLIPPFGIVGAATATLSAYVTMFLLMTWNAQRVFPVPYQWRRLALAAGTAVALTVAGKLLDVNLPAAIALAVVYPLALLLLGFYLPAERQRIGALGRRVLTAAR
jgi:O-antigen/teichoic acid export membrane protein